MTSHQHYFCLPPGMFCFLPLECFAVTLIYFTYAAVQWHPPSYERHFKMLHQIPAAPVCSKSGPYVDLVQVGLAHVDHLCYSHLLLEKANMLPISEPSTTACRRQYSSHSKTCSVSAPRKAGWPEQTARAPAKLFWQMLVLTIYSQDQRTCPPPRFPLRCFHCARLISLTWYSV